MSDDPIEAAAAEDEAHRLAREYVDLWESQIKALSGDEAMAQMVAQAITMMNAGAATVATAMRDLSQAADHDGSSSGASSSPPSSGDAKPDVSELARRIAALERRLDQLESGAQKTRGRPRKRT